MVRVSFQGERGAYSEAAARSFFPGGIETVPRPTFADALADAASGASDCAVLPVENSIEGGVGGSYDLLYSTPLGAAGEIYHRIEHCLIGAGPVEGVSTVYSHPQALGQCRRFIEGRGMRTVPTYDTAGSVGMVKELGRDDCACIASREAAGLHGLPVISEDIADNPVNHTRFLVMSGDRPAATGRDKTSIIFSIRHEPGSLFRIMRCLEGGGINLTKIESRPTGKSEWEYNFYLDFEGHRDCPEVSRVLGEVGREALFLKVLGSYPAARTPGDGAR